jgi:hypothetical protein
MAAISSPTAAAATSSAFLFKTPVGGDLPGPLVEREKDVLGELSPDSKDASCCLEKMLVKAEAEHVDVDLEVKEDCLDGPGS